MKVPCRSLGSGRADDKGVGAGLDLAQPCGGAVASRLERLDVEPFDGAEVLGVGRDEGGHVHDGRGADERIGQMHTAAGLRVRSCFVPPAARRPPVRR